MNSYRGNVRTCLRCGSNNIIESIEIKQAAEVGSIGLNYSSLGIFRGVSPLYADLCKDCGTIDRFFVKETDRPWIQG